jgi:hypothetical protein
VLSGVDEMSTNTTIIAQPQHNRKREKYKIEVDYIPANDAAPIPNDIHIEISELNSHSWEVLFEAKSISSTAQATFNLTISAITPDKTGTFDIRIKWTHDGNEIGQRTTQIFVQ